jgi:hypothetical protein
VDWPLWLGLSALVLGLSLLLLWWLPNETRIKFPMTDAPASAGYRRTIQLTLPEHGGVWRLLWRLPDHKRDGCVVTMACGDCRWESRASTIPSIETTPAAIRLGDRGLLNFSFPENCTGCADVRVSWVNIPQAWVGPACAAVLLAGLLWAVRRLSGRGRWVVALGACLLGTAVTSRIITDAPVGGDAAQNFSMALNLANHGIYSMDSRPPLRPTNYREPVPIISAACSIVLGHALIGRSDVAGEQLSRDLVAAKLSNLLWVFVGLLATWALAWTLTDRHSAGLIAALCAWLVFYSNPPNINSLLSETHAAALMAAVSAVLVLTIMSRKLLWAVVLGGLVGLLCLTKASFIYVAVVGLIGAVVLAMVVPAIGRRHSREYYLRAAGITFIAGATAVMVCMPWMSRNKFHFDRWSIAQRGGVVLMIRATKNQMTHKEWIASWWLWGPPPYRSLVENTSLGAQSSDFDVGGLYERLSRAESSKAVSYYHAGRNERSLAVAQARAEGSTNPMEVADQRVQRKAVSMILADPIAHLKCTLPFAWRGVWCVSLNSPLLPDLGTAIRSHASAVASGLLWLSLVWAATVTVLTRSRTLIGLALPSILWLGFHALATHNIPRYSDPTIPVMCVAVVVAAWSRGAWIWGAIRGAHARASLPAISCPTGNGTTVERDT